MLKDHWHVLGRPQWLLSRMKDDFHLLRRLTSREIGNKFIGSVSGWLWLIVTPLLLLGVYTIVFGVIFRARVPEGMEVPFIAWLAVALWPWLAFQDSILRASESIPAHAALISKVPMRREQLPLASGIAAFLLQLFGYGVVLLVLALFGIGIAVAGIPAALLTVAVLLLLGLGLGLFAATLRVYFADFQHLLPTLLLLWFFTTPILYAPEMLPQQLLPLVQLNPLAGLMSDIRAALFGTQWIPGASTLIMLPVAGLIFLAGLRFFRRMSPYFEDFL